MTPDALLALWERWSRIAGVAGIVLSLVGFLINREQFLRSYLFAYIYWTGMGIGCLGILLLHHTVGGKWGLVIRRFLEAGARTLPFMAVLVIPVLMGLSILYPWARPDAAQDPAIRSKTAYLNVPFFVLRTVLYFAIWTVYARLLSKRSEEHDLTGDDRLIRHMRALSAPGLVVFVLTATFAFIDWVMSLEPEWFSTIYGVMFLVGQVLQAFALTIALLAVLSRFAPFDKYLTAQHFHDLGNLVFAFTVLWAYLSFSQFLIIWAGNLPEEIPWYLRRLGPGWGAVAVFLVLFHFAFPFLVLLQRTVKRRATLLLKICVLMIFVRMVDVYWLVEPAFYPSRISVRWVDLATVLAVGGIWLSLFFWQLRTRPLLPMRDRRLEEAPRETVAF